MTDIHTHLIPGIDDGSESYDETKKICEIMKNQGVDSVILTPHYYADNEDPGAFLYRRDAACETIADLIREYNMIKGAEVRYYNGIGSTEEIESLLIEGTGFLLLELQEKGVNEYVIDDLMELRSRNIRPVLAHLNRYKEFRNDGFIEFCNVNNILIQLNTECIFATFQKRRAFRLIASGMIQFLATDCHDLQERKPNLKEAFDILRKNIGEEATEYFIENESRIIYA